MSTPTKTKDAAQAAIDKNAEAKAKKQKLAADRKAQNAANKASVAKRKAEAKEKAAQDKAAEAASGTPKKPAKAAKEPKAPAPAKAPKGAKAAPAQEDTSLMFDGKELTSKYGKFDERPNARQTVPLAFIDLQAEVQCRTRINPEKVQEYTDKLTLHKTEAPPVELVEIGKDKDGNPRCVPVDGEQRIMAAQNAKRKEIQALVRMGTLREAMFAATAANAGNGLPMNNADKRKACIRLLSDPEWRKMSDSLIGKRVSWTHVPVGKIRAELGATATERTGADGTTRKVGNRKTGKNAGGGTKPAKAGKEQAQAPASGGEGAQDDAQGAGTPTGDSTASQAAATPQAPAQETPQAPPAPVEDATSRKPGREFDETVRFVLPDGRVIHPQLLPEADARARFKMSTQKQVEEEMVPGDNALCYRAPGCLVLILPEF